MMAMRNIWVMIVGICLFGCGVGKHPAVLTAILNMETGKR